jgi:hypothetical protein
MSDPRSLLLLSQHSVKAGVQPVTRRRDRVLPVKERNGALKLTPVVPEFECGHGMKRVLRLYGGGFGGHRVTVPSGVGGVISLPNLSGQ